EPIDLIFSGCNRFIIRLPAYVPNDERGPVLRAAVTA
ncbi:MAG: hypothetical protein AMXMBFR83_08720, partial [Phycisphaerae bacterium]